MDFFVHDNRISGDDRFIELAVQKYSQALFRVCLVILGNREDAEDALQETFLRYMTKAPEFESAEHEKAWLIRVATNISKNMNRFKFRSSVMTLDEIADIGVEEADAGVFEGILSLPSKQKIVMTLHYIEGYNSNEISEIIGISPEAVRKRLQTGRHMLRTTFEKDGFDG